MIASETVTATRASLAWSGEALPVHATVGGGESALRHDSSAGTRSAEVWQVVRPSLNVTGKTSQHDPVEVPLTLHPGYLGALIAMTRTVDGAKKRWITLEFTEESSQTYALRLRGAFLVPKRGGSAHINNEDADSSARLHGNCKRGSDRAACRSSVLLHC